MHLDGEEFFFIWHMDLNLMLIFSLTYFVLPSSILDAHYEEQCSVKWKQKRNIICDKQFVLSLHVNMCVCVNTCCNYYYYSYIYIRYGNYYRQRLLLRLDFHSP